MRASLDGGTPTTLATTPATMYIWDRIAVDANSVYWATGTAPSYADAAIMAVPIGGGAQATVASPEGIPQQLTSDGTSVYWTEWGAYPYDNGAIVKVPIVGGPWTAPASTGAGPRGS